MVNLRPASSTWTGRQPLSLSVLGMPTATKAPTLPAPPGRKNSSPLSSKKFSRLLLSFSSLKTFFWKELLPIFPPDTYFSLAKLGFKSTRKNPAPSLYPSRSYTILLFPPPKITNGSSCQKTIIFFSI